MLKLDLVVQVIHCAINVRITKAAILYMTVCARANVYHTVQHIVPLMLVYIITYVSSSPKEYTPSHNIYTYNNYYRNLL